MNKITIYFDLCTPAPAGGYKIYYRVAGTSDAYTFAGAFFISPAVFYDTINPPGTCYEGYIQSDCGNDVLGNIVPFVTCESDSGSGGGDEPGIALGSALCRISGNCNDNASCGVRFSVEVDNPPPGSFVIVTNIIGSSATVTVSNSVPGTATIDYTESNSFGTVSFDLQLIAADSITILSTAPVFLSHQSYYSMISACS